MKLGEQREGGRCGSCQEVTINGVRCHEHGCPEARRYVCPECGTEYKTDEEVRGCCLPFDDEPPAFGCCSGVGVHDIGCESRED